MIYALQSSSAVNYGDVEIKELCSALESIFQVKIEDPYRTFIDIANRKTTAMKFIPKLEEGFLRKVDEADGMRWKVIQTDVLQPPQGGDFGAMHCQLAQR